MYQNFQINPPGRSGTYGYSGLMLVDLMMRAALSLSLCTKCANSACVMAIGSAPCFASQSRRSAAAKTRATSFASFATTPAGVPAGTHTPYQTA